MGENLNGVKNNYFYISVSLGFFKYISSTPFLVTGLGTRVASPNPAQNLTVQSP